MKGPMCFSGATLFLGPYVTTLACNVWPNFTSINQLCARQKPKMGMSGTILLLGPYQTTLVGNVWANFTLVGQKLSGQSAQQWRGGEDFEVEKKTVVFFC